MNTTTVTIAARFRGPPHSGNGGYACGAFADLLRAPSESGGQAAEVTLRSPVPLDTAMRVEQRPEGIRIYAGETLVAEARSTDLSLPIPAAPSYESAAQVRAHSPSLVKGFSPRFPESIGAHPFCFCCGAEHGDGLEVYAAAGASLAPEVVAAAWPTKRAWGNKAGQLPARFVWTALDCPGQAAYYAAGVRTGMLGQLCARIVQPIAAGERCVVIGWQIGVDGRKHFAGTALFNAAGECCAYAKAIWVGRRDSGRES
jgi:hypothetical protein